MVKKQAGNAVGFLMKLLVASIFIFPFLWMISLSLQTDAEVAKLTMLPATPTLENFKRAWQLAPFGMYFQNSIVIILSIIAIAISVSLRSATKGKLSKSKIILHDVESNEAGYRSTEDLEIFLGREGTATTVLRPTGMADFDGVKLNVVSEGEFVSAGTKVQIVRVEGSRILVRTV